ncbi:YihY/virulence factor BrkB family protein [soil metagenome]
MFIKRIKDVANQLKNALKLLVQNDPMRLAGATSFFTTFALPPILLILIQILSLLFNRRTISRRLFNQLEGIVGSESVHQLISTLRGFRGLASNWPITIAGFIFLLFVASTLFKVIQSSLNQLWMIRKTGDKKFKMAMVARVKSVLVIVFTGLLFLTSLVAESLKTIFGNYLQELLPATAIYFNNTITTLLSITIVWMWFTVLFRYLPDGRPTWKVALTGGFLTSILFNIGKVVLKNLLPNSNIGELYGASASIVLLLLFVFYSSLIFYYGAAFTKVWGEHLQQPIKPMFNASLYGYKDIKTHHTGSEK